MTLDVLAGLKRAQNTIHCLTGGWNDGDFHQRLRDMDVSYESVKLGWLFVSKPFWTLGSLWHLPYALFKSRQAILSHSYDVIYTNSYRQITLLYPWLKRPVFFHAHNAHEHDRQFKWLLPLIDRKITTYVAVSESIREDLITCGVNPHKIALIYNGVDIVDQAVAAPRDPTQTMTFGIVGQVGPWKGHEDVIQALSLLQRQGRNDFRLLITGKGDIDFEGHLKNMIAAHGLGKHIVWRGFKRSLTDIYAGIDVLLAPARSTEAFGLVAAEANALGIPAIVSRVGGLTEIIRHQYNGLIVSPGDPHDLADAMAMFLDHPALLEQLGRNGYKNTRDNFSLRRMQESFSALFAKA